MALTNMLKMIFNHLKKSYAIFSIIFIFTGALLFIPSLRNINIGTVSVQTICNYCFILCGLIVSAILGSVIFSGYGKTLSIITNNKTPLLICSIICGLTNSIVLSLVFLIFRLNPEINEGSVMISLVSIFLSFLIMFFLGACYGMLLKEKKKIVLSILIIALTALVSFKTLFLEYLDFYNNLIFSGYKENSSFFIISLIIINVVLTYTALITYIKPDIKKSTF